MNWNQEQLIKQSLLKTDPAKLDFSEGFYENILSYVMTTIENKEMEKNVFTKVSQKHRLISCQNKPIK